MQRPFTGARALSCLCAAFRAFRFARRCSGWLSRRMRLLGRACLGGHWPPVQKKRALFLTNRDRLGRSTGLSAAFALPDTAPSSFRASSALLRSSPAVPAGGRETFRVSGRDLLLPPELAERGGAFLRRGTFCPCKKYPKPRLGDWRPACSPACGGEQRPPPPKNPREFTGGVIRIAWSIRAAHGYRIDESLTTIAIDLVLPSASAAFAACAVLRCCLPVPRDPGFRRPPE